MSFQNFTFDIDADGTAFYFCTLEGSNKDVTDLDTSKEAYIELPSKS